MFLIADIAAYSPGKNIKKRAHFVHFNLLYIIEAAHKVAN
jgi:hypothetical protein